MKNENGFPGLLERFFTQRLIAQRRVSSHTIASYRDTFRLLLQFVQKRLHKPPSGLTLTDLDPSAIGAFLDELEKERGNGARSRKSASDCHPVLLPVRCVRGTHPIRPDPTHSGYAGEALREEADWILDPARNRCHSGDARSQHLVRPQGSRLLAGCRSDWLAAFRDDQPAYSGCRVGNRRPCALRRQRAKREMHHTDQAGRRHSQTVAAGTAAQRW